MGDDLAMQRCFSLAGRINKTIPEYCLIKNYQCSAKALEKWGQMTHTIEKYGDICDISQVTSVILPFMNLKCVGTLAPTLKIIGDIPDFNVLNVPKPQPRHNPEL